MKKPCEECKKLRRKIRGMNIEIKRLKAERDDAKLGEQVVRSQANPLDLQHW